MASSTSVVLECMTIAEIAYQVADYMKLDRSLIHPATTEEMNESTPRPASVA